MRFPAIVAEAVRSLVSNVSTTVAATMTVLIGMFLLGVFLALGTWLLSWSENTKDKLLVKTYFCTEVKCPDEGEATSREIDSTRVFLYSMPEVREVKLVSKEAALEIMRKRSPELVENISSNPLPHTLEITPKRAEYVSRIASRIERAIQSGRLSGVDEVDYGEKTARGILRLTWLIWVFFIVAVATLTIAATLLIANTIRLSIFSRRREIEVMKLVGATNWFVRGPFMIEGLLCGLAGAVAAIVLLLVSKELASPILDKLGSEDAQAIDFMWNAAILAAVGLGLGAVGSALTIRRFLRV